MKQGKFSGSGKNRQQDYRVSEYQQGYASQGWDQVSDQDYGQYYDQNGGYAGFDPDYAGYYGDPQGYDGDDYGDQSYGDTPYEGYQEPPRKKHRAGPWIVGILFYTLLIGGSFLVYSMTQSRIADLDADLRIYEQAQPANVCQSVFDQYFGSPDWAALYDLAGEQPTVYEGREAFAAYMTQKVGENSLSYRQIPTGDLEIMTYGVFLEDEKVAEFTMQDRGSLNAPDWGLGTVKVFYSPEQSYRISVPMGTKVSINGQELNESHVILEEYVETVGEENKITLPGMQVLEVRDLLTQPAVKAVDAAGAELPLTYEEASQTFSAPESAAAAMGEEEKQIALDALHTYCKFMINKAGGPAKLKKYFKADTPTYKAIVGSDLSWIQKEKSHGFADETVTDYVRYSDDRFSVRASLTWQLTRPDDSVKESLVDMSMVFEKEDGKWLCTRMTGLDLTQHVTHVRLTFMDGKNTLSSEMLNQEAETVKCPVVSAPEGKTFSGWMTERTGQDGSIYYQRVLVPEADGTAKIPSGLPLEPMILYPVYE